MPQHPRPPQYIEDGAEYEAVAELGETLWGLQRLYWTVEATRYETGDNWAPIRSDSEVVEASFPDPKVTLLSPAFLNPSSVPAAFGNGCSSPTSNDEMDSFLRGLAARNDWMTYNTADTPSEEGRAISYVYLDAPSGENATSSSVVGGSSSAKVRIWLQGGVHGNEPAGDQCLLALLGKMDADASWTASLLAKVTVLVLPRYNPDGVARFQRELPGSHLDANRDHVRLASPQTRTLKRLFNAFAPHVAADMHEYSAHPRHGDKFVHGADALFSAAKNLNIHPLVRSLSEDVFAPAVASGLERDGFRWEPYVTGGGGGGNGTIIFAEAGSDGRIGRNAMGLTQCVSFLCETRGIGLGPQEFARRTAAGLSMATALVQTAATHAATVLTTVGQAQTDARSDDPVVVTDQAQPVDFRPFTLVDTTDGKVVRESVAFVPRTPTRAVLTRARPAAYLIPAAWAGVADRLRALGLAVQVLERGFRGEVQALRVTAAAFETTYLEGVVPVRVETTPVDGLHVDLPPGCFRVSVHQRNAALAVVALEPECVDSYVACNVVPVEVGALYPIYRVLGVEKDDVLVKDPISE